MKLTDEEKCRSIFIKHLEAACEEIAEDECQGELVFAESFAPRLAGIAVHVLALAEECCVAEAESHS